MIRLCLFSERVWLSLVESRAARLGRLVLGGRRWPRRLALERRRPPTSASVMRAARRSAGPKHLHGRPTSWRSHSRVCAAAAAAAANLERAAASAQTARSVQCAEARRSDDCEQNGHFLIVRRKRIIIPGGGGQPPLANWPPKSAADGRRPVGRAAARGRERGQGSLMSRSAARPPAASASHRPGPADAPKRRSPVLGQKWTRK